MHYVQARREAAKLFLRLRKNQSQPPIVVTYAKRFPPGECIIAVTIPIWKEALRTIIAVGTAHAGYHYPPAIINCQSGLCLRLIWRFRNIQPGEDQRQLKNAQTIAKWAEECFGIGVIISPMKGLVGARWKLRAL